MKIKNILVKTWTNNINCVSFNYAILFTQEVTYEWLWRGDLADINAKIADVENIYTSTDEAHVKSLLEEYDISYIFVGSCERKKYGAQLNNDMLKSMGEVVYQDDEWQTYIVKVK